MSEKIKLTPENFQVEVNGKNVKDIIYDTVYLDHNIQEKTSDVAFDVPIEYKIKKGDEVKVYFNDNLEMEGRVIKINDQPNAKLKTIIALDDSQVPPPPKMKWAFEVVNNWGQGNLIILALVCNRIAGLGIIIFNCGFYVFRKEVEEKIPVQKEIPKQ